MWQVVASWNQNKNWSCSWTWIVCAGSGGCGGRSCHTHTGIQTHVHVCVYAPARMHNLHSFSRNASRQVRCLSLLFSAYLWNWSANRAATSDKGSEEQNKHRTEHTKQSCQLDFILWTLQVLVGFNIVLKVAKSDKFTYHVWLYETALLFIIIISDHIQLFPRR